MSEPYDVVVIGGGPGGYVAAIRAAKLGGRVALVEKERVGGVCLNHGCIPTKTLIHDAELYYQAASGRFCVDADGPFRVNFDRLMARKREVVESIVGGVERLINLNRIALYPGRARILSPSRVQVTGDDGTASELACRAIVVATGSVPMKVNIPGVDLPGVIGSRELLDIDHLPGSMVVIGGSAVGLEFASAFHMLGTEVTLLGRRTFLKDSEEQLTRRLRSILVRRGIKIQIGLEFQRIERTDEGLLRVYYERRGKEEYAEGEVVLLAAGRRPCADGLGLEELGVCMNGPAVAVNEYLETNVPGIYAIGDCIGGYMFAHVASREGEVAVGNILGQRQPMDYRVVPYCFFTTPEMASVGLTEVQATELGLAYRVTRYPFRANGRAMTLGEEEGQIRMICEETPNGESGKVLGVHIMGPRAGTLIAEAALAMQLDATAKDIAHTIHTHPTLPEAFMEAAMEQVDGAIHFERI
jgi:dihydrolipoamide dehydrogenase